MPDRDDEVEFLDSLQRIFATRNDLKTVVEYQQRLFASLQQLNDNHKTVHDHVRKLTDSHNRSQDDTATLVKARNDLNDSLKGLTDSHRQTREEIRRALDTIAHIQKEIHKIPALENRIDKLEQDLKRVWQDDRSDDRKAQEQEQRLRKLERK